jgi:type I restriction-modification system DNA methylase subunit
MPSQAPESSHLNATSASLGDLCALAVKKSSTAIRECAPLKSDGTPQVVSEARDKNANFAWVQHMLHHLAPNGSMALLLANRSMSSNSSGEGDIRRALIEADLVECMVVLPGRLFSKFELN